MIRNIFFPIRFLDKKNNLKKITEKEEKEWLHWITITQGLAPMKQQILTKISNILSNVSKSSLIKYVNFSIL